MESMKTLDEKYIRIMQGYCFSGIRQENGLVIYEMKNSTGYGEMVCYDVFPGVMIAHNKMAMETCYQDVGPVDGFLQINYCYSGCYEFELDNGSRCFVGEGDLVVNDPEKLVVSASRLPRGTYEGISVMVELEPAERWLKENVSWGKFDLNELKQMIGQNHVPILARADARVGRIFQELFEIDNQIKEPYFILKVTELFLFLSLAAKESMVELPHFSPEVVESTMQAYHFLTEKPLRTVTLPELAAEFHVSETSLRCCFKSIYGQTVGAFQRKQRINIGAQLLKDTEALSVGEIALRVGYENPSKFSKAFKDMMGETPLLYRHRMQSADGRNEFSNTL